MISSSHLRSSIVGLFVLASAHGRAYALPPQAHFAAAIHLSLSRPPIHPVHPPVTPVHPPMHQPITHSPLTKMPVMKMPVMKNTKLKVPVLRSRPSAGNAAGGSNSNPNKPASMSTSVSESAASGGYPGSYGNPYFFPNVADDSAVNPYQVTSVPGLIETKPPAGLDPKLLLSATGVSGADGRLAWPASLKRLPGSETLRLKIDALFQTAMTRAATGSLHSAVPLAMDEVVERLESLFQKDQSEVSHETKAHARQFLRDLHAASRILQSLTTPAQASPGGS